MCVCVLVPLLCQRGEKVGSVQCEAVTRIIKQGALGGEKGGERENHGQRHTHTHTQQHLGLLLQGLCGVRLLEEGEGGGGGVRVCEWTDLTLPVLTAILTQRPPLSDEIVLCLLERMLSAVEVCRNGCVCVFYVCVYVCFIYTWFVTHSQIHTQALGMSMWQSTSSIFFPIHSPTHLHLHTYTHTRRVAVLWDTL